MMPHVYAGTPQQVLAVVASHFGLEQRVLLSRARTARISTARFVAMELLRRAGLSQAETARYLHRHHSSVNHGLAECLRRPDLHGHVAVLDDVIRREWH